MAQDIGGGKHRRADVNGHEIAYLEWGDASRPAMVLLHGLTGHAHTWDHMAPRLAERYHVFAPDQRGHGDSAHVATYATSDFVDDLRELVSKWRLDRFVLMGLSMGGHNALAYAAAFPEQLARLIVIDIPPRMDRTRAPNWEIISKLADTGHRRIDTLDDAMREARAGNAIAPDRNLRYRTEWNLRERAGGGMEWKYDPKTPALWEPEDLWPRMPRITPPTLLVRGGKTLVLPRDVADKMIDALPNAELVEVPESGHSVPTDRPEELTEIVLRWLPPEPRP